MKKLISIMLVLVLAAGTFALAGCGNSNNSSSDSGSGSSDASKKLDKAKVSKFGSGHNESPESSLPDRICGNKERFVSVGMSQKP